MPETTPPLSAYSVIRMWYQRTGSHHLTALRWYKTGGIAKHCGVQVELDRLPGVSCARGATDIEYVVGGKQTIDGVDMTPEQAAEMQKMLICMANDARDAIEGRSTLVVVIPEKHR